MDTEFFRKQTEAEKNDFEDISHKKITSEKILRARAGIEDQKALDLKVPFEKRLPYPFSCVIEDFNKKVKMAELSKVGFLGDKSLPESEREKIRKKILKDFDWTPYTDPKNFKVIEEVEHHDQDLTKKNQGLGVFIKTKRYDFQGRGKRLSICESQEEAIERARKKLQSANKGK